MNRDPVIADLARHESEAAQTGRATETAHGRRKELVSNWIVTTGHDIGEPLADLFDDVEFRGLMQRLVGATGRGYEAVLLETAKRLRDLFHEKADNYIGEKLVQREFEALCEDADEARLARGW